MQYCGSFCQTRTCDLFYVRHLERERKKSWTWDHKFLESFIFKKIIFPADFRSVCLLFPLDSNKSHERCFLVHVVKHSVYFRMMSLSSHLKWNETGDDRWKPWHENLRKLLWFRLKIVNGQLSSLFILCLCIWCFCYFLKSINGNFINFHLIVSLVSCACMKRKLEVEVKILINRQRILNWDIFDRIKFIIK